MSGQQLVLSAHFVSWGKPMEASIVHIMESWPLQLVLQTATGREHAALAEDARIHHVGRRVDPGALQPGQRVRVLLRTNEMQIAELEILD